MKIRLLMLFCVALLCTGEVLSQGLGFKSTRLSQIADRTSYSVFADRAPKFRDRLFLSFDLSILDPTSFGFICVVDAKNSNKDYSLTYLRAGAEISYLKLNLKGEENLLAIPVKAGLLGKGKWLKVSLDFRVKEQRVVVTVNDKTYEVKKSELKDLVNSQIYFGKNENLIDVPSFAIRHLTVSNSDEEYVFNLKEYDGNDVHDQHGREVGRVENPVWLINDSYHWKLRFTYSADEIVTVNYDSINRRILVLKKDSLTAFDMVKNTVERTPYFNKLEVPVRLETSFWANGKLFVYEVNDVKTGCPTIASLDLQTNTWTNNSFLRLSQQLHHHNALFDAVTQKLTLFGGFGNNRMSKTFYQYDVATDTWNTLNMSGDAITPRFFSGMGRLNDQLLVFGGVGNKTGDQSIGKIYYYDCYSVDLKTNSIRKLWEQNRGDVKLVSTRDLIVAEDKKSFYTLCYPEYIPKTNIKLYQYNIKTGDYTVLGDSIPIVSEEIQTNANLYRNNGTHELYCVVQEVRVGHTRLSIYSIDNPPISADELFVNPSGNRMIWYCTAGVFVLAVSLLGWMLVRKRRKLPAEPVVEFKRTHAAPFVQPRQNAVYVFGLFTAYNRDGQDCTHLFSPQVKQLFLLILLRSVPGEAGITSEEIYSLLWPTKPLKNAKNLKGVTINKVRTILADFDGIELVLDKQHFKFQVNDSFYCDYFSLKMLNLVASDNMDDSGHQRLMEITSRGAFLQSGDGEYFDSFKRDFADHILVMVPDVLKVYLSRQEFSLVIAMCDVLYCVDELNESALYYVVHSCLKLGDEASAKKHFNNYILKYKKLQGEDFTMLYPEVVKTAAKYVKKN